MKTALGRHASRHCSEIAFASEAFSQTGVAMLRSMLLGLVLVSTGSAADAAVRHAPAHVVTAREVLNAWESEPSNGAFIKKLEAAFPADMLAAAEAALHKSRGGASATELQRFVTASGADLMQRNSHYLLSAPDENLVALVAATAETMVALRTTNVSACAMLVGAAGPDQSLDGNSPTFKALIAAIVAGRDSPVRRGAPTSDDLQLFGAAVRNIDFSDAAKAQLIHPSASPPSQEVQCEIGIGTMHALASIRGDAAGRIIAQTMAPPSPPAGRNNP